MDTSQSSKDNIISVGANISVGLLCCIQPESLQRNQHLMKFLTDMGPLARPPSNMRSFQTSSNQISTQRESFEDPAANGNSLHARRVLCFAISRCRLWCVTLFFRTWLKTRLLPRWPNLTEPCHLYTTVRCKWSLYSTTRRRSVEGGGG